MSRFCIHEEENQRPKGLPNQTKDFLGQIAKNRLPLQNLCAYQPKNQPLKAKAEKDNVGAMKLQDIADVLPYQTSDVLHLKSVFKKKAVSRVEFSETREYEGEIWDYLYQLEKQKILANPAYMSKQMHLTWEMRKILIDWLVSVGDEYKLNEKTLHLSVNYLDRFLSNISVIKEKFQLVGATAMMIAGKVEDVYPPDSKEWSFLTGDAFTVSQILKMEQLMLKILDFDLNPPTSIDFLRLLCTKHSIDKKTMYLAMYLSELVLLEGKDYIQYFPSKVAAASLLLARQTLSKPQVWPKKIEETSGYSLKQLSPVVEKQHKTFKSSPFREQQSIQKKYASPKYQKVALIKPRILVLDGEE